MNDHGFSSNNVTNDIIKSWNRRKNNKLYVAYLGILILGVFVLSITDDLRTSLLFLSFGIFGLVFIEFITNGMEKREFIDVNSQKIKSTLVNLNITKNSAKKICLSWSLEGDSVTDSGLLPSVLLLGYRLPDRLPHDPWEAKELGKLIINTRNSTGTMIDEEMRPGQTGYYALFIQGKIESDSIKQSENEGKSDFVFSAMATAVERAPEGEMAKLARKLRYQELEEKLKIKSGQGGSIAETARKDIEDAVAQIENYKDLFKTVKETKERNKEEIRKSNMSDEDKYELLEAFDILADDVIDKKIGMGNMT